MSLETSVRYSGDVAIIDLAGRIVLNDGSATMRETIAKLREGDRIKSSSIYRPSASWIAPGSVNLPAPMRV